MECRDERVESRGCEAGFTLPEVMTTVAILGILLAIAVAIWLSVIEARRVDAAANQLASDMRLAHTRATNQLTDWRLIYEEGESEYHLVKLNSVCASGCVDPEAEEVIQRELPAGTEVVESINGPDPASWKRFQITNLGDSVNDPGVTSTIEFNSDGGSYAYGTVSAGPDAKLKVGSSSTPDRCYYFMVRAATSQIEFAKENGCK